jgi:hypothetical protein
MRQSTTRLVTRQNGLCSLQSKGMNLAHGSTTDLVQMQALSTERLRMTLTIKTTAREETDMEKLRSVPLRMKHPALAVKTPWSA